MYNEKKTFLKLLTINFSFNSIYSEIAIKECIKKIGILKLKTSRTTLTKNE